MNECNLNEGNGIFMLKKPLFHPTRTYLVKVLLTVEPNIAESFGLFPVLDDIFWYLMKLGGI